MRRHLVRPPGLLIVVGIALFLVGVLLELLGASQCFTGRGRSTRSPDIPVPAVEQSTCWLAWVDWFAAAIGLLLVATGIVWLLVRLVRGRQHAH